MKKFLLLSNGTKIGVWALLAFAGSHLTASATSETFNAYTLNADWTNAEAIVWNVRGAARTPPSAFPAITPSASVATDGAGKITGTGSLEITYDSTSFPFSLFVVDITGRISSSVSKPTPVVTMNMKGSGYTVDANGVATLASINLKFSGQPGLDPSNPARTRIVGVLSGFIHGTTPLGEKSATLNGLVGFISASSSNSASISIDIVQSTKRMIIEDTGWIGQGSINTRSNSFKLSARGTGQSRGTTLALTGSLGAYTNSLGTNDVAFSAPVSVTAKGKISGQVVSGTTSNVGPTLIAP